MATLGKGMLSHAWNAFLNRPGDLNPLGTAGYGVTYSERPWRGRAGITNERSIISSIYTRLGIDIASTEIRHVRLDEQNRYKEDIDSGLNTCLTLEANIDQAASAFRQDIAMTLFESGVAAIVPVETSLDPAVSTGFDIRSLRVGTVVQWMPNHVRVSLFNEKSGRREELTLEKRFVAIIENPLYSVMNEPNSTLQRLIRKLNLLDSIDEQSGSGKLDLIIQLPYVVKTEAKRQQAEQRRKDIEFQLKDSRYGIAYTDGTEKVTQLNRPAENNLMGQIEYLTKMLYSQLGLTPEVMEGTASEEAMLNYHFRTVEPIVRAIVEGMRRSFLTKTARSQKQWIMYFRDPFKLVPISQLAEIADKLTRNEVVTSNEIRAAIGLRPSQDPKSDQLINSNMPVSDTGVAVESDPEVASAETDAFDALDKELDDIFSSLGVNESDYS